jgi:multidrug resistance protein, MATE family
MEYDAARHPIKRIAALAWPILIGQLAVILNGVLDTAMTSRYSATDLAALAVGSSIYVSVFVGGHGVLQALSPAISQLFGARRYEAIGMEVKQGAWLAVFLSMLGALVLLFPHPFLSLAHASPELNAKAVLYLQLLAIALPATLGFRVFSGLNNALARPKVVMAIHVSALLLKVPLNALFIFGGFGIPALGGPGAAIATAIVSWLTLFAGVTVLRTSDFYDRFHIFGGFVRPQWQALRGLLRLGVPMGLSYLIEVTAFTFMAVFIARLGVIPVSGHQIAANFGTLLYMLPLAIANATATLVAHSVGARELRQAKHIGNSGILLAASLSIGIGCTVWFSRGLIVRAYTPDPAIMAAALPLFMFVSVYQLFDAIQVTTAFVLRAYKIVIVPTLMYAFALWGVGLGGGYLIGLDPFGVMPAAVHGAAGFWIGNSTSLAIVAIGLFSYLRVVQREVMRDEPEMHQAFAAK